MTESHNETILAAMTRAGWLTNSPGHMVVPAVDVAPQPGAYLGIDLGGTKIAAAFLVVDETVSIVEHRERTDRRGGGDLVAQLGTVAERLIGAARATDAPAVELRGIALGCPGILDPVTGAVHQAPNLPGWDNIDVRSALVDAFGLPVTVDNDVNLAAWGEHRWSGSADLAFLALGTGIGLGTVLAGELRHGARGEAGEICHLPLGGDPFDEELQRHGVLESRLSGAGIVRAHRQSGGIARTVPEIFDAAAQGDATAGATLSDLAQLLALTIRTVAAVLDPAETVLGGGIGARPELLEPTKTALAASGGSPVSVRTSTFGHRATMAGALAAAVDGSVRTVG